ncbi:MAG: Eco57I restriction-modification methylase domain-containing protein, partial [Acidobacteriota bacterium]|nr:Eco57I restriction-modification methylase domain-containing protein [Acidobacteriota bacterium]
MPVNITQHALNFGPPHRNQALFSDHFLDDDQRLKAMSQWRDAEGVDQAFAAIKAVFDSSAVHFGDSTNEDQTEDKFIVPVLKILGWEWETEEHIAHCGGKTPDYALLLSHDDWQAIQPKKGKPEFWASVPALADAKAWPDSLDKKRAGETPTVQISNYLYRSKVRWGILTNGRQWRLYEADKSRAGGIYYEVDLLRLLQGDDDEAFRYFYLFFRRDALVPVGGETFLDLVFRGSAEHAARITDHLKESVYDALRYLMNGFLSHPRNGLDAADPGARALVHDQSLIVLYRLLFILYAEDRDLLPREEDPYKSYSLFQVQRDINVKLRNGTDYNRQVAGLWHSLLDLFQLIDGGLRDEKKPGRWLIPPYNGGLFSVSRFPQIAHSPQPDEPRWEIGDFYLAQVIDMLAYDREQWDQPGAQDLDYATLEVQHLGSIYEGLLELRPELAAVDMIEQPGGQGKGPIVVEAAGLAKPKNVKGQPPRRFATGEVYLATDKGERKATGSYYTPRYIVDYIVENTVGRLCDEAAGQVIAARDKLNAEIAAAKRAAANPNASTPALALPGRLEAQRTSRLLEPYLSLKILDPAMGSGHFLVAAADTLSLAMATDPNLPDAPAPYTDNPQPYYKRLVARHCLYGVDLNWLAVELAKLSLWLHTVQKDTALDFLDHHLRWGNSLIGARIEDDLCHPVPRFNDRGKLATADAGQLVLGFWENLSGRYLGSFLDTLQRIMDEPATDAEAQKKKDRWFREMDRERDRFRQVANLWLAPHFGVAITDDQYQRAVQALHQGAQTDEWRSLAAETWFQDAYAVGGNVHAEKGVEDWRADTEAALRERESVPEPRRFFHWELEFPHAFFAGANWKAKDERGFGAVIGNPPYIRIQNLPATQRQHFGQRYRAAAGDYDIYVLFVDVSIGLTRRGRRVGMIHPHKFVETRYGEGLRRLIVDTAWIAGLLDFGHAQVFDEATTYACVLLLEKGVCGPLPRYARVNASPEAVARAALRPVPMALIEQDPWQIRNAEVYEVMGRLVDPRTATRVGSLCRPHYSLFTGLNEAFIVDEKEARARGLEPALLRPLLKGEHATKW